MKIVLLCMLSLTAAVGVAGAIGYRPTLARWGAEGVRSMMAIGAICMAGAVVGAAPMAWASVFRPAYIGQAALAGTAVRLLLTIAGAALYQLTAQPELGAFLFWAVIFYLLLLSIETGFALYLMKKHYRIGGNGGGTAI